MASGAFALPTTICKAKEKPQAAREDRVKGIEFVWVYMKHIVFNNDDREGVWKKQVVKTRLELDQMELRFGGTGLDIDKAVLEIGRARSGFSRDKFVFSGGQRQLSRT